MNIEKQVRLIALAVALPLVLGACAQGRSGSGVAAALRPTQGQAANGTVQFESVGGQVMMSAHITGLKPNAEHGFHVHEKGDCSAPDGTSAGGHYNPGTRPHGAQTADHHAGDMPNLKSDAQGRAEQRVALPGIASAAELVGRSVIVHALPDDYRTQPTGNSGARIACGVIAQR